MPDIILDIPSNTKFNSSLNEIDIAFKSILIEQMRIADPRDKSKEQKSLGTAEKNNWLWDKTRVFQVDEMTTGNMSTTTWIWIILAVAAIIITAFVWYYAAQDNNRD